MRNRRNSDTTLQHVRNLIELGFYADAAHLLHQGMMQANESMIERAWGEFLHRYRFSVELLRDNTKGAGNELVDALQAVHQQNRLRIQIRFLRAIDPEASEMAERLLWHTEPRKLNEGDGEKHRPFERWVAHGDDE